MLSQAQVLREIQTILDRVDQAQRESKHSDLSDLGDVRLAAIVSMLSNAISRFAPAGSSFREDLASIREEIGPRQPHVAWPSLMGVVMALHHAYQAGYLEEVHELIHADVFNDFLEMAEHLLEEGYKDPSAVLVGGVLEEHLRTLCTKNGIATANPRDGKPLKSDTLNNELAKHGAYDKLEQKSVTAWLDLRNKAAHGEYTKYDDNHVDQMLRGVRDFVARHRA